jgi:hypothetical protein
MIEIIIPITCLVVTGAINSYINNFQKNQRKKEYAKKTAFINKINKGMDLKTKRL